MALFLGGKKITPENIASGYIFYGEETFPASSFIDNLVEDFGSSEEGALHFEKFDLKIHPWKDIIDTARTMSLFSDGFRIIVVESPLRKKTNKPSSYEDISSQDEELLKDYFSAPSPTTVIVIIFPGKINKYSPLVKFLSSLPASSVVLIEMKPVKGYKLREWIISRFKREGKTVADDAISRLMELAGNDLRRLDNEMTKVITFIDEKKQADLDDVDQVTGWVKSFVEWELTNKLEKGDYRECLIVVEKLLEKEGVPPVRIVDLLARFFRDILLVKLRLEESKKSKKDIFKEIKPQIKENYGRLYDSQFKQLFFIAGAISDKNLENILTKIRDIDMKLKSTGVPFKAMIEGFLFQYCLLRTKQEITWERQD